MKLLYVLYTQISGIFPLIFFSVGIRIYCFTDILTKWNSWAE